MNTEAQIEANRRAWDEWATLHMQPTSDYRIDEFRAGEAGWEPNLPDDIGDVTGKSILHLQCHFGKDSLMWARQGARVTGVDFSGTAIQGASSLNAELGLDAEFIQSDVYALPGVLTGEFDIVLTYYGVLCWLPDLARWARIAARYVKPGGFLYVADSHPVANTLEVSEDHPAPTITCPYFSRGEPEQYETGGGTYAAPDAQTSPGNIYEWQHALGDIVNAVIGAGLTVEYLHEFPYLFWDMFCFTPALVMEQDGAGWWRIPGMDDRFPLMFSLKARRKK